MHCTVFFRSSGCPAGIVFPMFSGIVRLISAATGLWSDSQDPGTTARRFKEYPRDMNRCSRLETQEVWKDGECPAAIWKGLFCDHFSIAFPCRLVALTQSPCSWLRSPTTKVEPLEMPIMWNKKACRSALLTLGLRTIKEICAPAIEPGNIC